MRSREPEPIDAGPDFRINKPSDTTSTLVSIYDSKDLFVKELQVLLAQRLLAIQDGNFDNEASSFPLTLAAVSSVPLLICFSRGGSQRRNIEILKVRFGEAPLQVCEVMLKDMTDSKRIDQHIQAQNEVPFIPQVMPWLNDEHSVYCIRRSSRGISGRLYKGISWSCQHNSRSRLCIHCL